MVSSSLSRAVIENKQTLPAGWKFIDDSHRSRWRQIAETLVEERISNAKSASRLQLVGSLLARSKGSNERLSRVDTCKDEGHSDTSSIKRVTSSSEGDCFVFSMKKGSLSAATKSRI